MKLYIQMECILSGWQEMLATILLKQNNLICSFMSHAYFFIILFIICVVLVTWYVHEILKKKIGGCQSPSFYIGGSDDHHCLNFLFIIFMFSYIIQCLFSVQWYVQP
jgi:hypothetical protein